MGEQDGHTRHDMLAGTGEAVHLQKTGEKSVPLRGHGCLTSDEVTRLGLGDSLARLAR